MNCTGCHTTDTIGVQVVDAAHQCKTEAKAKVATLEISVRGEARTVQASSWQPLDEAHTLHTGQLFTATIGRGVARYPASLILFRVNNGERPQPGNKVATDQDGRRWEYHLGAVVRNRQAQIVGWDDVAIPTNYRDQTRA